MADIVKSLYDIRLMDELSQKKSVIHDLHPISKLVTTIGYLITVVSFQKYQISSMLPLILYIVVIMALTDIPLMPIVKRVVIVLPFVIGVGVFNPLLDRTTAVFIGKIPVSYGWLSFLSIIIKCMLTVTAVLLFIASTGINSIALALRMLRVPKIFVMQLLLTYRYISVLIEEALRITRAYSLRSPFRQKINLSHLGSIVGQLLMRSMDRAERVYESMACRGFQGEYNIGRKPGLTLRDIAYTLIWILFFVSVRFFSIPMLIGMIITGGLK